MKLSTLTSLLVVVLLTGLIEVLVGQDFVSRFLVAQPSTIVTALVTLVGEEHLGEAILSTFGTSLSKIGPTTLSHSANR